MSTKLWSALYCPTVHGDCLDPTCGRKSVGGSTAYMTTCTLRLRPEGLTVTETNEEQRIHACMERLAKRYRAAQAQTSTELIQRDMDAAAKLRRQLREWFEARMEYLQDEYRMSINRSDNIIGKQWAYDQRPRLDGLTDRYRDGN